MAASLYGYTPDAACNLLGIIFFGVLWAIQTVHLAWFQQWWFSIAWFIGCGLETAGFIGRYVGHFDTENQDAFLVNLVCLNLSAPFYMAGIYYLLAQMTVIEGGRYSMLKPMMYSKIFIVCDFISIVLQGAGGGVSSAALQEHKDVNPGSHIMEAGLVFQVVSMLVFIFFFAVFIFRRHKAKLANRLSVDIEYENDQFVGLRQRKLYRMFPLFIMISVLLILTRCIYRVAELSEGWQGYLNVTEVYFLVLDGLMLFFAVTCLTLVPPGLVFRGYNVAVVGPRKEDRTPLDFEAFEKSSPLPDA